MLLIRNLGTAGRRGLGAIQPGECSADGRFVWARAADGTGYWRRRTASDTCQAQTTVTAEQGPTTRDHREGATDQAADGGVTVTERYVAPPTDTRAEERAAAEAAEAEAAAAADEAARAEAARQAMEAIQRAYAERAAEQAAQAAREQAAQAAREEAAQAAEEEAIRIAAAEAAAQAATEKAAAEQQYHAESSDHTSYTPPSSESYQDWSSGGSSSSGGESSSAQQQQTSPQVTTDPAVAIDWSSPAAWVGAFRAMAPLHKGAVVVGLSLAVIGAVAAAASTRRSRR